MFVARLAILHLIFFHNRGPLRLVKRNSKWVTYLSMVVQILAHSKCTFTSLPKGLRDSTEAIFKDNRNLLLFELQYSKEITVSF